MIQKIRKQVFYGLVALSLLLGALAWRHHPAWAWGLAATLPLVALGIWDMLQTRHNLLRNYPLVGHLRFLIEDTGPELRQYIVESNTEGRPFDRDLRSLIYQRAKNVEDKKPFGTEQDVYLEGYTWLAHSMAPKLECADPVSEFRVDVGGEHCTKPYSASVLNISAMSYGSLSANAVLALNDGARRGNFAHVTGEGGLSRYHREPGGDLVWQIGTGYFGCRNRDGTFDPDRFKEQAALDAVRMIELKLSQGAKPGHGGILPGVKVNAEIAAAREVPEGQDCVSPSFHTTFTTPIELLEFVARLRDLSGGKPVGFKLCVGRFVEFYGVCKAMLETGIMPDFITVDGAEGGTGAAPIEFSDNLGLPLREGIVFVHNSLVGMGLRDKVRIAAAGRLVTGFRMAIALALGADWCNTARGFMFSLGCIQAQRCHTNKCPVGVATQDPRLGRALVPADKSVRVHNFHHNTVQALAEVIAAAGFTSPSELTPRHIYQRTSATEIASLANLYPWMEPGQLLDGHPGGPLELDWQTARADTFTP